MSESNTWERLVQAINDDNVACQQLLMSRVEVGSLQDLYKKGFVEVEERTGDIVALVVAFPTRRFGIFEIGCVWVHEDHRMNGLGKVLWQRLTTRLIETGTVKSFVTVTKIKTVKGYMEEFGWVEEPLITWKQHLLGRDDQLKERTIFTYTVS